jgi:hypothetical protein
MAGKGFSFAFPSPALLNATKKTLTVPLFSGMVKVFLFI